MDNLDDTRNKKKLKFRQTQGIPERQWTIWIDIKNPKRTMNNLDERVYKRFQKKNVQFRQEL